ncbi:fungal-specific transcription factor domain-containing protein [Aspergillus pseudoustus]|uniref:Fungal-specific transcription factor domain-containing protein n=1 Tax=Aspergillus pseudoustus TaxID=1810923 RepID=A0ABR4KGL9_9EURO
MEISPPVTVRRRRTRDDRRRTARACDRCRRLKEKCEGGIPCLRCSHLRHLCEFRRLIPAQTEPPLAEALRQPERVNVQELLERVTYMEKILKHKVAGIDIDLDSLRRMARALDEHERSRERPTTPVPPDDSPIEEEFCTIDPVEDTTTHYSGEFSYWNFSMRVKRHIEDRIHPQPPLQVSTYLRAEHLHSGINSIAAAISCCPPRHIADFLINVFFKHAATYYFYVDRAWLVEKVDALYTDSGRFNKNSAAVVSIILTVLAIATQYAYLDAPRQREGSGGTSEFSEDALGTMFYQQAVRFLPEIIESSSLESVQACLLFAVYALPVDASGLGYIYITLTNRLGMQNGMHREYTGTGLTAAMIETRNRIWWTAYTLERKLSIFHGRPLSTQRSDVDAKLPIDREHMLSDGSAPPVAYMVASIELARRLEGFSQEMFLLRTCSRHERSNVLLKLLTGKKEMDTWWKRLLDEVLGDTSHLEAHTRAITHLHLEYHLVCMFTGRPLLLNRLSSRSPASPESLGKESPVGSSVSTSQTLHRQELVRCCVQAAREALNLCRGLRDNGPGLARSSYIEYSSCRASILVLIAHSIQTQSAEFRAELRVGLDMIRQMVATGESARSEVALLESLERALVRLQHSGATSHGRGAHGFSNTRPGTGYDTFKKWEALWKAGSTVLPDNSSQIPRDCGISPSSSSNTRPSQGNSLPGQPVGNEYYPESPTFGELDNSAMASENNPELRFLQEFLAIPGYGPDGSLDMGSVFDLGNNWFPFQGL